MYKYNVSKEVSEQANDIFLKSQNARPSVEEPSVVIGDYKEIDGVISSLDIKAQQLHLQVEELHKQKEEAINKLNITQVKNLTSLINNIQQKIAAVNSEKENLQQERNQQVISSENVFTQLKQELGGNEAGTEQVEKYGEETVNSYNKQLLIEDSFEYLKDLDVQTAYAILDSNPQLLSRLGEDVQVLKNRLKNDVD